MEQYYFLYKDSTDRWCTAINPVFIAQHKHCRAIPKAVVNNGMKYEYVLNLVSALNNDELSSSHIRILGDFDIWK